MTAAAALLLCCVLSPICVETIVWWRRECGRPGSRVISGAFCATAATNALDHDEGIPVPAAIAPGTSMSDVTGVGDSFYTNELVDNVLVSPHGLCQAAAQYYAAGHDMKDPLISPVYGDMAGFPPTILTSGTRDLLLSNTVRVHRKLRQASVEAALQIFEGQSHAHYLRDDTAPETQEAFAEISDFFDKHIAK
ncbi:MAG: alpha/beta hydrolase [Steroidobacteraceae bacterium]